MRSLSQRGGPGTAALSTRIRRLVFTLALVTVTVLRSIPVAADLQATIQPLDIAHCPTFASLGINPDSGANNFHSAGVHCSMFSHQRQQFGGQSTPGIEPAHDGFDAIYSDLHDYGSNGGAGGATERCYRLFVHWIPQVLGTAGTSAGAPAAGPVYVYGRKAGGTLGDTRGDGSIGRAGIGTSSSGWMMYWWPYATAAGDTDGIVYGANDSAGSALLSVIYDGGHVPQGYGPVGWVPGAGPAYSGIAPYDTSAYSHGEAANHASGCATYGPANVQAAPTDYLFNLRIAHPPFHRVITWQWAKTWSGSYTVTAACYPGSTCLTVWSGQAAVSGVPFISGDAIKVTEDCFVSCARETITISGTDTGSGASWSYALDSNADGQLIADLAAPELTGATFCYQATTHQCVNLDPFSANTSVGAIWVRYNFTGGPGGIYTVEGCERALELLPPECWPYTTPTGGVSGARAPGSWALTFMHDTAHDTNQAVISVRDSVGRMSFLMSGILPVVAGGEVTITPQAPITDKNRVVCDQFNVVCGIQSLFTLAPDAIRGGFDTLMQPLKAKQPFATIIGSAPTILGQLGRASAAVTSTSTCTGVPIIVPLGVNGLPTAAPVSGIALPTPPRASASPMTVTVLDCATFESFVSQWSWFPTVRSFMDVAIYAAYGYSLLQRWQPRAQMNA